ncbi:MAG: AtpZ/AtpI family protein [Tunicatimonas sp.]|uniref:AtpZ/AtpI family protein n=1 Tax=Tunicatimonas sp. TaxID=1940096 RepID=UPI003C743236
MNSKKPPANTPNPNQKKKPSHEHFSTYAKYSGLAFQMIAVMGLAVWGGIKLDERVGNRFPFITIVLLLLALTGSIILLIRQLPKE